MTNTILLLQTSLICVISSGLFANSNVNAIKKDMPKSITKHEEKGQDGKYGENGKDGVDGHNGGRGGNGGFGLLRGGNGGNGGNAIDTSENATAEKQNSRQG